MNEASLFRTAFAVGLQASLEAVLLTCLIGATLLLLRRNVSPGWR